MKILFIVNPVAGGGKALVAWEKHKNDLKSLFPTSEAVFTKAPGDATSFAMSASEKGFDTVISCGGDGTLNEVVNGIVGSGIKVGIFPLGTGSDFGKSVGIRDYESFLSSLNSGKSIKVDIALSEFSDGNRRYFINSLEAGFGADVMQFVDSHRRLGKISFIVGILATIARLRKFDVEINIDSRRWAVRSMEIIVANGKYFGGGMLASPGSRVDDSILDVHILKPIGRLRTIIQLRELINGTYIEKGHSIEINGKSIEIDTMEILVEMDGEVAGKTPVKITLIPGALDLLIPQ